MSTTNTDTKKTFPARLTKSWLQTAYGMQMSEDFIRKSINTIITDKRNISCAEAPKVKLLLDIEVREFIFTYGPPRGYEVPAEFAER